MALLLETNLGDLTIDLDIDGSPALCQNILKLAKARYLTGTLVHTVVPNQYASFGDPRGDGTGGACIYGVLMTKSGDDIRRSTKRFLPSVGRRLSLREWEQEKGLVVATEINNVSDTIGSQFSISLGGLQPQDTNTSSSFASIDKLPLSLGRVTEDPSNVLENINKAYLDPKGRPFADIRIIRALVIHDPFVDPKGMTREWMKKERGVEYLDGDSDRVLRSPSPDPRPNEEVVDRRLQMNELDADEQIRQDGEEEDRQLMQAREEEALRKQDKSRAIVLEMLGDLPDAELKAPEDVLFVCKLNPVTTDEDLELIFARFDRNTDGTGVKAEIIRDADTGNSLCYAFVEFTSKEACVEAYFKMNNALIDDRRIKVDFSQSVAKIWDKYNQRLKPEALDFDHVLGTNKIGGGKSAQRRVPPSSRNRRPPGPNNRPSTSTHRTDRTWSSAKKLHRREQKDGYRNDQTYNQQGSSSRADRGYRHPDYRYAGDGYYRQDEEGRRRRNESYRSEQRGERRDRDSLSRSRREEEDGDSRRRDDSVREVRERRRETHYDDHDGAHLGKRRSEADRYDDRHRDRDERSRRSGIPKDHDSKHKRRYIMDDDDEEGDDDDSDWVDDLRYKKKKKKRKRSGKSKKRSR